MTGYKLVYFNVMGLAEPIRFLLSYGGIDFEDVRLDHSSAEWVNLKPKTPFGQLPTLEIDGKVYSQTLPICQYLAKQFNLRGKTDLDNLQIDAIANALHDFRRLVISSYYRETDPILKAKKKTEVFTQVIPSYLKKLEELAKNNGGYLYGGELSYADLFFVAISDAINTAYESDITKDILPKIQAWVEKRPNLKF
ncbi:PREDICTED: glutathione S-transferase-like [Dufourea novaeangliae]|uniref:glutathione transferase n=1 Tax=Dufourea novaeangliae TaxID=178035 RepID=A0A154NWB8_DUFNO|nr:PREDICTED: glutathione S-transferase-like [Dufourea novaeangliae]KZC03966.1 Glutathione S-transferase [Dufourea novaeangliae]